MDECTICLDCVEKQHSVSCDRGHPLHWRCYRELVNSTDKRPRCPTCRCYFACAICEGGSQIICVTCMRDKTNIRERPTGAVFKIMHQHIICWGIFIGLWSFFIIEQNKRAWGGAESELIVNVLFFINFHFNVWMCCDRVIEAVVLDALNAVPMGDSSVARKYHDRIVRILKLHRICKRSIGWFAVIRIVFFIYDALLLFGDLENAYESMMEYIMRPTRFD